MLTMLLAGCRCKKFRLRALPHVEVKRDRLLCSHSSAVSAGRYVHEQPFPRPDRKWAAVAILVSARLDLQGQVASRKSGQVDLNGSTREIEGERIAKLLPVAFDCHSGLVFIEE